jgi:hypothetical protein
MGNLKELHKTVTMFMLDEERRLQAADPPDFPTDDQLGKDYASGDAGYPYSIISYYGGGTVDKLRCPAVHDGSLGYALNANLFNASRKAVDQGGTRIDYTELENSNILLYDANPDKTPANRHGGKCYGITIFGDIDRDVTNADLQNKND